MKISELAIVIRSKNAGPFITTCDLFFRDKKSYEEVKNSGVISKEKIAKLYKISVDTILGVFHHDAAMAIKVSFLKPQGIASGDVECSDVLGAQQHVPLLEIEIP